MQTVPVRNFVEAQVPLEHKHKWTPEADSNDEYHCTAGDGCTRTYKLISVRQRSYRDRPGVTSPKKSSDS